MDILNDMGVSKLSAQVFFFTPLTVKTVRVKCAIMYHSITQHMFATDVCQTIKPIPKMCPVSPLYSKPSL